jgi:transposase
MTEENRMSSKRKSYSAEEKVSILKRHLLEKVPVSDLCDEHGLHPTVFYRWQKEFFEKGVSAFNGSRDTRSAKLEKKVSELEAKLSRKHEVLSELMEEHIALKKSLGET